MITRFFYGLLHLRMGKGKGIVKEHMSLGFKNELLSFHYTSYRKKVLNNVILFVYSCYTFHLQMTIVIYIIWISCIMATTCDVSYTINILSIYSHLNMYWMLENASRDLEDIFSQWLNSSPSNRCLLVIPRNREGWLFFWMAFKLEFYSHLEV